MFALLVVLAAAPALAQPQEQNVIIATGTAELRLSPDRAVIVLGVEVQKSGAAEAMASAAHTAGLVLNALRKVGIPKEALQTSGISLAPVYAKVGGVETIVGYRAAYTITAVIDDLDLVGKALDGAVAAGANRVHGVSFTLRNPAEARRKALAEAAQEARAKATAIAEALGLRVKRVVRIIEQSAEVLPSRPAFPGVMQATPAVQTPIEPGQVTVTARVTAVFEY
jgi:uncharacterized protein YggE